MNRRNFLMLAGAALLVPERTIFLPPRGGWFNTPLAELVARYADQRRPVGLGMEIAEHSYEDFGCTYLVTEHLRSHRLTISVANDLDPAHERFVRQAALSPSLPCWPIAADLLPGVDAGLRWAARTDYLT